MTQLFKYFIVRPADELSKVNCDRIGLETHPERLASRWNKSLYAAVCRQRKFDKATYMIVIHELYDTVRYNQDTHFNWIQNMDNLCAEL